MTNLGGEAINERDIEIAVEGEGTGNGEVIVMGFADEATEIEGEMGSGLEGETSGEGEGTWGGREAWGERAAIGDIGDEDAIARDFSEGGDGDAVGGGERA